jgi:hypothetical protein
MIVLDALRKLTPQTVEQQNAAAASRLLEEAETVRAERLHKHLSYAQLDAAIVDRFTRLDLITAAERLNRASTKLTH